MSTIGSVIERINRDFLYPPDNRPAQAHLDTAIDANDLTLIFKGFVIPEDEELVKVGAIIELGQELMQLVSYDELTLEATVLRARLGSTAAEHAVDTPIYLSPPYTRLSVFEAVADNIITLYPSLFTVVTEHTIAVGGHIAPIGDELAVSVIEAWPNGLFNDVDVDARIVDYSPAVGSRAVVFNVPIGEAWVKYKRRFGKASTEADLLADLGVDERWVRIVAVGAAADLLAGRDIPAAHTEWIQGAIEAEQIPVGTRSGISLKLASYRNYLIEEAKREMKAEYRGKIHSRGVGKVVTRSPFG